MDIQPVTLAELRAKAADYRLRAEKIRVERSSTTNTSRIALNLTKAANMWDARALDYERLIKVAELVTEQFAGALMTTGELFQDVIEATEDGSSPNPDIDVVAYISSGGSLFRCLDHAPNGEKVGWSALIFKELPEGRTCTHPVANNGRTGSKCGVDPGEVYKIKLKAAGFTDLGSSSAPAQVAGWRYISESIRRCVNHPPKRDGDPCFVPLGPDDLTDKDRCTFPIGDANHDQTCDADLRAAWIASGGGSSSVTDATEEVGCQVQDCGPGYCPGGTGCPAVDKSGDI